MPTPPLALAHYLEGDVQGRCDNETVHQFHKLLSFIADIMEWIDMLWNTYPAECLIIY